MLEMEPLFISILGAPDSGKSYFLTAMTWQLRQFLTLHFKLAFTDADTESNRALNECEESLFLNPEESEVVPLEGLIVKTRSEGKFYDSVDLRAADVSSIPGPSCSRSIPRTDIRRPTRRGWRGCFASTTTRASISCPVRIRPRTR